MSRKNYLIIPVNQTIVDTPTPKFRWDTYPDAKKYNLKVFKLVDWEYVPYFQLDSYVKPADDECNFTLSEPLDENEIYKWTVDAVLSDDSAVSLGTYYFAGPFKYKTHPANSGKNFTFNGPPSQEVIDNYLSRGVTCNLLNSPSLGGGIARFEENLRMLLYTGAKYVQRANTNEGWAFGQERWVNFLRIKSCIEIAHCYDPEIIFEAGVFEWITPDVETHKVPAFAFELLGLPVEDRYFVYKDMQYKDGHYAHETHAHPDVSRTETMLWFIYRAALYIDCGFESIHLGSTPSMSDVDGKQGYKCWRKICDAIHEYAKTHARRGWVLLNAHCFNMMNEGEHFFDFYAWLINGVIPEGSIPGEPTEDHPQKVEIRYNPDTPAVYGKGKSGKHPCGYEVERASYVVEFDNYGINWEKADTPWVHPSGMYMWGYEDIAWISRQPESYRRYFFQYAYDEINKIDKGNGHITFPLLRVGCYQPVHANLSEFGYGDVSNNDEVAVRNIFIKDNSSK